MNRAKLRVIIAATFVFYSVILCYFLFFADYYGRSFNLFDAGYFDDLSVYISNNINFIPFATVILYIRGYLLDAVTLYPLLINLMGNFAAFMPLGFFVPYFFRKLRRPLFFTAFIILLIVTVEFLQLIMMTGVCDIDDLILNVAGSECIFVISKKILFK